MSFHKQVLPILERRGQDCHPSQGGGNGLALTGYEALRKGGQSGPTLAPGKPEESLLVKQISGDKPRMPKVGALLEAGEVGLIGLWIAQGARDDTPAGERLWWSFQRLVRPKIPAPGSSWVRTPIDAFILARLKEKGLAPSPGADRRTLIRRLRPPGKPTAWMIR